MNTHGRRTRLSIFAVMLVLSTLGLPATSALGGTSQEINSLPTLDALNLSNEGALHNTWRELAWTSSASGHKTGQETTSGWAPWDATTVNGAYWKLTSYNDSSGDAATFTMQVGPGSASRYVALWLNMPGPDSVKSGYQLRWTVNSGSNYTVKLSKWSSGIETVLASNASVSITAGTTMAISDTGGTVSAWQGTGGSLTSILSASDTAYASGYAGIEGIGNASRSINFKAGPLMGAAVGPAAVLDNLERNESPLATGKWSKSIWAGEIGGTRMGSYRGYGSNSGVAGAYWGQESFNDYWGGTLVAGTVGTGATPEGQYLALWLNMPSPSSARSGYEARFTGGGSASNYKVELSKWSSGTRTVLASTTGFSLPAGTTMALTKTGRGLVLWTGTNAMAPVLSVNDGTYGKGYAGLEVNGGAGTIYNFKAARVGLPPMDTSITSGARGVVLPQVSFSFGGLEGTSGFECSLDGGPYSTCSSPKSYSGISEGSHTFRVRAVGITGVDETPAERNFQVVKTEKLATKVALLDNLERNESPLATGKWSKSIWAGEMGGTRMGSYRGFGSTVGQAGAYWNQKSFMDDEGTIVVAGTVGTGATTEGQYLALWLNMPSPSSARSGYEARFTGGGSASNYKVELSKWSSGTRTVLASTTGFSLPVGTTMALTETPGGTLALYAGTSAMSSVLSASDSAYFNGAVGLDVSGAAGTIYNFRAGQIDIQAPETTVSSGPTGIVPPAKVSFTFTSTESGTTECSLDGGTYSACTSPRAYPGLADGKHTFRVRATDLVGNQDETPAERSFTVYKQPEAVTQPTSNVNAATANLNGIVNPNGLHTTYQFEYGTTTAYGSKAPANAKSVGEGTSELFVSELISGLQANTVYHYRVVATSTGGTTNGKDRTFIVDQVSPTVDFDSSQTDESAPEYTLSLHAEDPGAAATGIQQFDILLNGKLVSTIPQPCPWNQCSKTAEVTWKHKFTHPLDGSDHLTVITLDQAQNTSSSSFDLPSRVARATIYTGNPAQGGTQIAEEWSQLNTHDSRRQETNTTFTKGSAECLGINYQGWCSYLRSDDMSDSSQGRFSEAVAPIEQASSISEAASLSMPSQSDFGKLIETGLSSQILQSWQAPPPGAGTTFEKLTSSNEADESTKQRSGEWTFWVDIATKLPFKASLREGEEAPQVSYYTYGTSMLEAGDLSPDFFMLDPSSDKTQGCLSSGQLGGWKFTPGGFTYPDPRFNALVNTASGPILVVPEGAAGDGYDPRMIATADGVELRAQAADQTLLHWEFTESPDQTLEAAGPDVIVVSKEGTASAIIQSSTPNVMSIVDGTANPESGRSGDEILLEPTSTGADAELQPLGMARQKPCITPTDVEKAAIVHEDAVAAGVVRSKPSGSGSTTTIKIWINPHPTLQDVQVTDKYGACNGPSVKTFGIDGWVEYGGCPVGKDVTFTVPHEVSASGITYAVPDSSRTIKPPAAGWVIEFNYVAQPGGGGGGSEGPPPHMTPFIAIGGETEAEEEAQISSEQPVTIEPGAACEGRTTKPYRTDTAIPNLMTAEAKFRFRCREGTTLAYWFFNWNLSIYDASEGQFRTRKQKTVGGYGPAYTNQGPYVANAACRGNGISLEDPKGKKWRSGGEIFGFFEEPDGAVHAAPPDKHGEEKKLMCG